MLTGEDVAIQSANLTGRVGDEQSCNPRELDGRQMEGHIVTKTRRLGQRNRAVREGVETKKSRTVKVIVWASQRAIISRGDRFVVGLSANQAEGGRLRLKRDVSSRERGKCPECSTL